MGVHHQRRPVVMKTIKVQALANVLGLRPGEQVEMDRLPVVDDYLAAGLLVELRKVRKRRGKNVSE